MGASATVRIPLFRPLIREEAVEAVADVLRSGWVGHGPKTREFETAFAEFVDMPDCVSLSSCTAALQLALRVLDLPPRSEVVTTPLTFVSANQAILHQDLRPVFADVQPDTGNIEPGSVATRMGERTGAVLVMHYGGYPCDLDELYSLAHERGVALIEDCAHACGAIYRGRRVGSHGDLHAFSFNAVKNLPTGDGGAVTLRSPEHAARMRRLRWSGISRDTYEAASGRAPRWDYQVRELGFKYQMTDVQAAIGLAQLHYLDEDNARRAEIAARYRVGLAGVPGLELLRHGEDRESSHHLFCVLAESRDDLVDKLADRGIDAGVHYRPSYDHPMFEGEPLPGVESFWRRAISLPMHVMLGDDEVDEVCEVIRDGW
jgi:perosamine synthetase